MIKYKQILLWIVRSPLLVIWFLFSAAFWCVGILIMLLMSFTLPFKFITSYLKDKTITIEEIIYDIKDMYFPIIKTASDASSESLRDLLELF